jgi:DNA-binding MarR family transcriptional regulator
MGPPPWMRYTERMAAKTKKRPALRFDPASLAWIGLRLTVLSSRYMAPLTAALERAHGLTRDDVTVTICLAITNARSAQDIVRYTGRPKNSVSRAVVGLERRGVLRRHGDPSDRRSSRLALTARGRRLFEQIAAGFVQRDRLLLAALSAPERRTFSRLLVRIAEASAGWADGA